MNIGVLIPAFNEKKTIGNIIFRLKELGIDKILVIDDGSFDNTAFYAESEGAFIIRHSKNEGKGVCIKEGLEYFRNQDIEGIILMDGDGQHNPAEIIKFLGYAKAKDKKMVVGNRMKNHKNMPALRLMTNKVMSFIILLMCKEYVPDTQCGYRFLRKEIIDEITLTSCNYEIESEMVLKVAKAGHKIYSVPITTIYKEEISQIDPIRDGLRFLKLVINFLFRNYKRKIC